MPGDPGKLDAQVVTETYFLFLESFDLQTHHDYLSGPSPYF